MSFIWGGGGGSWSQGGSRTGEFMTAPEQNKLMHKSRHTLLHPFLICTFFVSSFCSPPLKPATLAHACCVPEHSLPTFSPVGPQDPQVQEHPTQIPSHKQNTSASPDICKDNLAQE